MITTIREAVKPWAMVPLGDAVTFANDRPASWQEQVPFLSMEDLPTSGITANRWALRGHRDIHSGVPVRTGDLLVARITPSFENGKQGVVGHLPGGWGFASTEVHRLRARPGVDLQYVAYFLKKVDVRRQLAALMEGTTGRQRLPRSALERLLIPLPPLGEQQRIARILSTIDGALSANDRLGAAVLAAKRSLVAELYATKAERERCEELCLKLSVGIVVRPTQYYSTRGIPALRSLNVREDEIDLSDVVYIDRRAHESTVAKSALRPRDVVIVRTGYPGTSAVIPESLVEANCIDLVFARAGARILPEYLSRFFNSPSGRAQALAAKTGMAQQHLNVGAVARTLVPVPPLEEQRRVVQVLTAVDGQLQAVRSRGHALLRLFHSVIAHVME